MEDPMGARALRLGDPRSAKMHTAHVSAVARDVHKKHVENSTTSDSRFPQLIRKDMTQDDWQLSNTMERYSQLRTVILKPLQLIGLIHMNKWMDNGDFNNPKSIVPYGTSSQHARQFINNFEYGVRGSYSGVGFDDPKDDESVTDEYRTALTSMAAIKFVVYSARKSNNRDRSGWLLNKISPDDHGGRESAWVIRRPGITEIKDAIFPPMLPELGKRRIVDVRDGPKTAPIIVIFYGKRDDWNKEMEGIARAAPEVARAPAADQQCIVSLM